MTFIKIAIKKHNQIIVNAKKCSKVCKSIKHKLFIHISQKQWTQRETEFEKKNLVSSHNFDCSKWWALK